MMAANTNGKNLTLVMIQFWILAALANNPETIVNHKIITKTDKVNAHHGKFHPKA
jgi:hypothetical protein